MELILSQPLPSPISFAINSSNKSSNILSNSYSYSIFCYMNWDMVLICIVSQIPSHPISRKWSSFAKGLSMMSGSALIIYSSGFRLGFCLYCKSPIARERFRFELTLPSFTNPLAFVIRSNSFGLSGLWSSDNHMNSPFFFTNKHQESPAFATKYLSFVIKTTFAVQP